ncbi:MAG TPA: nuclear transport factor 2 family protein [Sphingomonas sp.]|nr:nuclear transport factor 2 family protein [Sphingomonas sp.]
MRVALTLAFLMTASAASAEHRDAQQVVTHHVAAMKAAALDNIMSDYAVDAVVVTPPGLMPPPQASDQRGVFSGRQAARAVFAHLTNSDNIAGIRAMETRIEPLNDNVTILHWTQFRGTPNQVAGHDLFVVHNGKITLQDIVVETP